MFKKFLLCTKLGFIGEETWNLCLGSYYADYHDHVVQEFGGFKRTFVKSLSDRKLNFNVIFNIQVYKFELFETMREPFHKKLRVFGQKRGKISVSESRGSNVECRLTRVKVTSPAIS